MAQIADQSFGTNDIFLSNRSLIKSVLETKEVKQNMVTFQTGKTMCEVMDKIVDSGVFHSRSEFIRHAIVETLKHQLDNSHAPQPEPLPNPPSSIEGTDERGRYIIVNQPKKFYFGKKDQN